MSSVYNNLQSAASVHNQNIPESRIRKCACVDFSTSRWKSGQKKFVLLRDPGYKSLLGNMGIFVQNYKPMNIKMKGGTSPPTCAISYFVFYKNEDMHLYCKFIIILHRFRRIDNP